MPAAGKLLLGFVKMWVITTQLPTIQHSPDIRRRIQEKIVKKL